MSTQSVLFDAPGPRTRRWILLANILGALLIAGVLAAVIVKLAAQDQLQPEKWDDFLQAQTWVSYLLPGLIDTLQAAAVAVVASVLFGLIFGVGRLSHVVPIRWISALIVEFLRAVPVLLMMIFFWLLFSRTGIFPPQDAPFAGVVVALTLYNGSVIAELVRSGVHGLPKGQREAGMAIGMTRGQSLRSIEIPQALIAMLPALISQFVVILKDSALGAIITYTELLFMARLVGSGGGNMLPALAVAALIFIVINFALSTAAQRASGFLSYRSKAQVVETAPASMAAVTTK